ncbi:pentatricopeptide repeat-containing protein [Hibiscus syriacus]|uniref:Pentatricopeptide repeat-containing protein n=1 Tax=Hibiscus syriacus TaxID=106335 RepID=A0A6A3CEF8_HIBSY|nr:pentatricopeptide repeat-containing protein [Hibiscus syriacus]
MKKMMEKLPDSILGNFGFDFLDAPCPAKGKFNVESIYDPTYYEWYQVNEIECVNFEECVAYIEDYMIKHGPCNGLLSFSEGNACILIPQLQRQGLLSPKYRR